MKIKIIKAKSIDELEEKLQKTNNKNIIAITFASINIRQDNLYKTIDAKGYSPITISSSGQFIKGKVLEKGITCMLLEAPKNSFKIKRFKKENDYFSMGKKAGSFSQKAFEKSNALIFTSMCSTTDSESILKGFQKGSKSKVALFGTVASGDFNMKKIL